MAAKVPVATPRVGAKSATVSRTGLLKNGVLQTVTVGVKMLRANFFIQKYIHFFKGTGEGQGAVGGGVM